MWAAENVHRQGYVSYFPKTLVYRKNLAQAQPLFAGYLFVCTAGSWNFLLNTYGVAGVVTFGESPALISSDIIDGLRAREVDGCVVLPTEPDHSRFKAGQGVRVKGGVFSGCVGIYEGSDPKYREKVLLDFLGRKTSVFLSPDLVEEAA